ncbi:MAG: hypothetical protein LBK13_03430 [Spirochaetales bacterium]|jgi:hypothetical protein|nr:hypothetical protein [Spirochaetales bacterium]
MLKKVSFLVLALCLLMGAQVFMGCDANSGDDDSQSISLPAALKGKWVSGGTEVTITSDTFTDSYNGSVSYAGVIVNVISDGDDAGYIIIQYTSNSSFSDAAGRYYAVHYKNLTASTMEYSGAYSGADPDNGGGNGKLTQEEAEETYTVLNGYFDYYSTCTKQ